MSDSVLYQWVLVQHDPRTEQGKSVQRLMGRVYYLINQGRTSAEPLIVAFKFVGYPIPAEYTLVTDKDQINKLERWDKPWLNHPDRRDKRHQVANSEPVKVADMFPAQKEE